MKKQWIIGVLLSMILTPSLSYASPFQDILEVITVTSKARGGVMLAASEASMCSYLLCAGQPLEEARQCAGKAPRKEVVLLDDHVMQYDLWIGSGDHVRPLNDDMLTQAQYERVRDLRHGFWAIHLAFQDTEKAKQFRNIIKIGNIELPIRTKISWALKICLRSGCREGVLFAHDLVGINPSLFNEDDQRILQTFLSHSSHEEAELANLLEKMHLR